LSTSTYTETTSETTHEASDDFSDLFPEEPLEQAPKRTLEDHRQGVIRARSKFFENAGSKPWLQWFPKRIHPRDGIDKEHLQHVGYLIDTITGIVPKSDQMWKRWRSAYAAMYVEANGDFDVIETAIHDKWDTPEFRATNPETYIRGVAAAYARKDESKTGIPTMKPKVSFQ
jgi:hypothetical protein